MFYRLYFRNLGWFASFYKAVVLAMFCRSLLGEQQFLVEVDDACGRHVVVDEAPPVVVEPPRVADGEVLADLLAFRSAFGQLLFCEAGVIVALLGEDAVVAASRG